MRSTIIRGLLFTAIAASLLGITGCDSGKSGYQSLLHAPKLNKENEEIRSALKTILPEDYQIVSAKQDSGEAIKFADIDGDGVKEVVLFYAAGSYSPYLECVVLKKGESGWIKAMQKTCDGYDINSIMFGDMNGDKKDEMAVLWSDRYAEEQGEYNQIELFTLNNKKIESVFKGECSEIAFDDINQDKKAELMLFKFDNKNLHSSMLAYTARSTKNGDIKIVKYSPDVKLQESAYYYSFLYGNAGFGKKALFIDGGIGAHSGITEIIMDKAGKLESVQLKPGEEYGDIRQKPYSSNSKDFDKDGVIEVSQLKAMPGYENSSMADTQWITEWFKWDGHDGLIFAGQTFENYNGGYTLTFPKEWRGKFTVTDLDKNSTDGAIEIKSAMTGKLLCRIYALNAKEGNPDAVEKLKESQPHAVTITKHLNKTIVAVFPYSSEKEELKITPQFIRKNIGYIIY